MHEDAAYTKRGVPRGQRATPDQFHTAVRDSNIELVSMVLEALEGEHEFLCAAGPLPCRTCVTSAGIRECDRLTVRGWGLPAQSSGIKSDSCTRGGAGAAHRGRVPCLLWRRTMRGKAERAWPCGMTVDVRPLPMKAQTDQGL